MSEYIDKLKIPITTLNLSRCNFSGITKMPATTWKWPVQFSNNSKQSLLENTNNIIEMSFFSVKLKTSVEILNTCNQSWFENARDIIEMLATSQVENVKISTEMSAAQNSSSIIVMPASSLKTSISIYIMSATS